MYVESRKLVQGNLLQNRNREADVGKRLVDTTRGGKGGRAERAALKL